MPFVSTQKKMKQILVTIVAVCCLTQVALGQIAPPKHKDDLEQRFDDLKCALVLIKTATEFGTGFFISRDGDIATASHVLGNRTFESRDNGTIQADLEMPESFTVVDGQNKSTEVPSTMVEKNGDAWGADVAVLKSGIQTSCWLASTPDSNIRQGEHLITMGFPGLAWGHYRFIRES